MNNILNTLRMTLPFTNEIANSLSISGEGDFKRIYKSCPSGWSELESKSLIDMVAWFGLAWNIAHVSHNEGIKKGMMTTVMLIILSYLVPELFMEDFVNRMCNGHPSDRKKCDHLMRFFAAVAFIVILVVLEHLGHFLIELLGK